MTITKPPQSSAQALVTLLADGEFHSGEDCAAQLGISRAAVHKAIQKLTQSYQLDIDRISGRGYRISNGLDLLDKQQIQSHLTPQSKQSLDELIVFPIIESTNQYLISDLVNTNKTTACFAECQTAGRGRRGNHWHSPFAQNIVFSLRWIFARDLTALRGLSLLVGLSIARYLTSLKINSVGLKWPNDIMINDKKVGGILLEVLGDAAGPCTVVIGIGLNVNMHHPETQAITQPWTNLNTALTNPPKRNQIAAGLLSSLIKHLQQFNHQPMSTFIASWQAFDILFQQEITWQSPQGTLTGTAQGVNENGELLVKIGQTYKPLNSGEVNSVRTQKTQQ